jgi:hypothetical protein
MEGFVRDLQAPFLALSKPGFVMDEDVGKSNFRTTFSESL